MKLLHAPNCQTYSFSFTYFLTSTCRLVTLYSCVHFENNNNNKLNFNRSRSSQISNRVNVNLFSYRLLNRSVFQKISSSQKEMIKKKKKNTHASFLRRIFHQTISNAFSSKIIISLRKKKKKKSLLNKLFLPPPPPLLSSFSRPPTRHQLHSYILFNGRQPCRSLFPLPRAVLVP